MEGRWQYPGFWTVYDYFHDANPDVTVEEVRDLWYSMDHYEQKDFVVEVLVAYKQEHNTEKRW